MSQVSTFRPGILTETRPTQRGVKYLLLGCCVVIALLAGQYFSKIHHAPTRSAFLRWGNQIEDLRQGVDIWQVHEYPNPPIMALVLMPFAQLAHPAGAMAWFALKGLLLLVAIRWVWRMLDRAERPLPTWARLVGLLLVLAPIEGDLTHGNVNLFILFLLTAALVSFVRGRDVMAGLVLGAAIACKLTPLLFVPYFAWKRAWKTLAGCMVGLVLFWGVVPGVFLGFSANAEFFGSWVDRMVVPYVIDGKVTSEHQNQSLPGVLRRLLTHSPSVSERVGTAYFPREFHNVLDLNPAFVRGLSAILMAGFVALVTWTCRTPMNQRRDWRLCAEFSLVILGMLLFSERTWKHHCVLLLLPGAVIGSCLAQSTVCRFQRRLLWTVVVAVGVLMLLAGSAIPGRARLGDLAQIYGAYAWALMLLVLATAYCLQDSGVVQE